MVDQRAHEAARIHHFRLVLERYEELDLELRDASGRRVETTSLLVSKQLVSADVVHEYVEVDRASATPCYLLMARLTVASVEPAQAVASAA